MTNQTLQWMQDDTNEASAWYQNQPNIADFARTKRAILQADTVLRDIFVGAVEKLRPITSNQDYTIEAREKQKNEVIQATESEFVNALQTLDVEVNAWRQRLLQQAAIAPPKIDATLLEAKLMSARDEVRMMLAGDFHGQEHLVSRCSAIIAEYQQQGGIDGSVGVYLLIGTPWLSRFLASRQDTANFADIIRELLVDSMGELLTNDVQTARQAFKLHYLDGSPGMLQKYAVQSFQATLNYYASRLLEDLKYANY